MSSEPLTLTEEQLAEARHILAARRRAQEEAMEAAAARLYREREDRFWTGILAKHPALDRDTMYTIYCEVRDFYE